MRQSHKTILIWGILILLFVSVYTMFTSNSTPPREMDVTAFRNELADTKLAGNIERVTIEPGSRNNAKYIVTYRNAGTKTVVNGEYPGPITEALYAAVSSGDSKALQKAPGVGKRLAERMAVDLKGKVPEVPTGSTGNEPEAGAAQLQLPNTDVQDQVAEALMGLGFPETKATRAVQAVLQQWPENRAAESSSLLRATLNYLGGQR